MGRLLKPYERNYRPGAVLPDTDPGLMWKEIDLASCPLLYSRDRFDDAALARDFMVKSGEWYTENGWIVGKNPGMFPGMIVSRADYFGAVMLEATVESVAPSTHDINFMISGEWDDEKNERGNAYVAGLEGFWHGNVGYEKSPDYRLNACTSLFDYDPKVPHTMRFGNLGRNQFVTVDGRLCLQIADPDPIDNTRYGKIGFEAFSSWWRLCNIRVYRLNFSPVREYYLPEF